MSKTFGVGRQAPAFTLPAAGDGEISLAAYRGDWFPVIVFFRHDDPAAAAALATLSGAADRLWGVRGQLLGVADADTSALQRLASGAGGLAFPLLADEDGAVARAYGSWDEAEARVVPTAWIVDRAGKLVWSAGCEAIPAPRELMDAFRDVVR